MRLGEGMDGFPRVLLEEGGRTASLFMITWTVSAQGFQVEKPTPGLNVQRLPGDLLGDWLTLKAQTGVYAARKGRNMKS